MSLLVMHIYIMNGINKYIISNELALYVKTCISGDVLISIGKIQNPRKKTLFNYIIRRLFFSLYNYLTSPATLLYHWLYSWFHGGCVTAVDEIYFSRTPIYTPGFSRMFIFVCDIYFLCERKNNYRAVS